MCVSAQTVALELSIVGVTQQAMRQGVNAMNTTNDRRPIILVVHDVEETRDTIENY
jgi:hypothetical protein